MSPSSWWNFLQRLRPPKNNVISENPCHRKGQPIVKIVFFLKKITGVGGVGAGCVCLK